MTDNQLRYFFSCLFAFGFAALLICLCSNSYDKQQDRLLFEKSYKANLECRQSLGALMTGFSRSVVAVYSDAQIEKTCGLVPALPSRQ
jgi:hypothetical protein